MIVEPGDRVPREHLLRRVKKLADAAALVQLSPLFDETYSMIGRPSVPPERLLKASLRMALYTVRSEPCADGETTPMRYTAAEKLEIIRLVEQSSWSVRQRLYFAYTRDKNGE
jgi:hypothetical protein